jgi:hypothetical protein
VPRVRHALSLVFPGENDGFVGLEPDLIGEHHVADLATDALVDTYIAWAEDIAHSVTTWAVENTPCNSCKINGLADKRVTGAKPVASV